MCAELVKYKNIRIWNTSSDYQIEYVPTGQCHGMGDGVDMLFDEDGNPLCPDTCEFNKAMREMLESNYEILLEAYFPDVEEE